eukprot:3868065-Pleurochrysis_carterae.AAC.1
MRGQASPRTDLTGGGMFPCRHAPYIEATFAVEGQRDPRAIGRGRRNDCERIAEHAIGRGRLPELVDGEQRVGECGYAAHVTEGKVDLLPSCIDCAKGQ